MPSPRGPMAASLVLSLTLSCAGQSDGVEDPDPPNRNTGGGTGLVLAGNGGNGASAGSGGSAGQTTAGSGGQSSAGSGGGGVGVVTNGPGTGHGLFTAGAPWYEDVSQATVDSESAQVLAGLAAKGGWGAGSLRIDFSIEVLKADAGIAARPFTKTADFFAPDCDFLPVPVPPGGWLEGESNYACAGDGDCHLIVIQGAKLYEMWRANITGGLAAGGTFNGGCLAVWDLTKNYWKPASPQSPYGRGDQCTSADAAGYPIADLLFTADEVKAGEIPHAIRFILPNDRIRKGAYVHPATHSGAGKGTPSADTVPYGARLRLKSNVDVSKLSAGGKVLAKALQRYGMFLADGGNIALTARSDRSSTAKWTGLLGPGDVSTLKVSDFEMVAAGPRLPLTLNCTRTGP